MISLNEHLARARKKYMEKTTPEQRKKAAKIAVEARIKKYNQKRRKTLTTSTGDDIIRE